MIENIQETDNSNQLTENYKDFEKTLPSDAALVCFLVWKSPKSNIQNVRKWMNIGYRLYVNMLDNSEFSFVLSFPQMISQLSFLMTVCQEKTTGLQTEFGWDATSGELAHQFQHKNLIEITQKFMKMWKKEINEASKPGKINSARRVLCYPTCAVSFHLKTLECLRRYYIEMALFEGAIEHRNWINKHLEGNFENRVVVNVWEEETINMDATMKPEDKLNKASEIEKKTPILVWISHMNIALDPAVFDVKFLYLLNEKPYFRITATPTISVREIESEMPWDMIIVPCVSDSLCFVLIYNFSRNLSTFEGLRIHINEHRPSAPCVVRKCSRKLNKTGGETDQRGLVEKTKKHIYIPHWDETNFLPNRFAELLQKVVDMEETFTEGGFGDLAHGRAVPSPGENANKISHLQNFSTFGFVNSPSTRKVPEESNDESEIEKVPFPFCAILWDTNRHVPVYMGKITGKCVTQVGPVLKKSWWERLSGYFKPTE